MQAGARLALPEEKKNERRLGAAAYASQVLYASYSIELVSVLLFGKDLFGRLKSRLTYPTMNVGLRMVVFLGVQHVIIIYGNILIIFY